MRCPGRTTVVIFLSWMILASSGLMGDAGALALDLRLIEEEQVGEGLYISHYQLHLGGGVLPVRKLTADLGNPFVQVRPMHPGGGFNSRQTVRAMATGQSAVAAVNADFFHMTLPAAPLGLHVEEGEMLSSPADNAWMGLGIDADGVAQILSWRFRGEVICGRQRHPLQGLNQSFQSGNGIYLYDRSWGTEVSEVFFDGAPLKLTVRDGKVTQMERNTRAALVPREGYMVVADGLGADFLLRNVRIGSELEFACELEPDLDLEAAVGGQALLVDGGRPVDPSKLTSPGSTRASRTAVGLTGRRVFFVTVDATPVSAGATMEELSVLMADMGARQALNLDGGGSTTMVARRLGEFDLQLVNVLRHGVERSVPNAIGIFNLAPRSAVSRLFLRGAEGLLVGTETNYSVTGHDRHFHPVRIDSGELTWKVSDGAVAEVADGTLSAREPGEITLQVSHGGVSEEKKVRVFGGADIADFSVTPSEIRLLPEQSVSLKSEVLTVTGQTLAAGPETVRWETDLGFVRDNTYYAEEEGSGTLRAEIDGEVREIPIRIGGTREPFFTFQDWQTTAFRTHPAGLPGSFEIQADPAFVTEGDGSGRLTYDFSSEVDGVMIAYGQLGSGQISMGSDNLGISADVYGDGSSYWLRAEIFDASGTRRYVDLAREVDWTGWRRVQGDIDASWPQPLILSSIYLVQEPHQRTEGFVEASTIYIDNIEMIKGLTEEDEETALGPLLLMRVNSAEYQLRGQPATMDAAPFIDSGRTFGPGGFTGEALGAEVDWTTDPQTGRTDKVIVETPGRLIILSIGDRAMIAVDKATAASEIIEMDVAPRIVEGRTYLPFRAIAEEGFGAEVGFSTDPETGRVETVWIDR
ncbi:MAG: phosphodiester glycosidase family protein [Bacillota bacterium]